MNIECHDVDNKLQKIRLLITHNSDNIRHCTWQLYCILWCFWGTVFRKMKVFRDFVGNPWRWNCLLLFHQDSRSKGRKLWTCVAIIDVKSIKPFMPITLNFHKYTSQFHRIPLLGHPSCITVQTIQFSPMNKTLHKTPDSQWDVMPQFVHYVLVIS